VINGFGRTGKMFAHQHYGVSPDIIAVAKGISSAYLPIAATVVKNNVFDSFYGDPAENRQVFQVNTYGGHPAAAAVALRNIEILEGERLADRAAEIGAYLLDGLRGLMSLDVVGDVRVKGLPIGVERVMGRVAGKVALVAGAGGGIGGAGADALAREGAAVFCTDRDGAAAEATAARIRVAGGQAAASALDVCDRVAVDAMVAAVVREFGR